MAACWRRVDKQVKPFDPDELAWSLCAVIVRAVIVLHLAGRLKSGGYWPSAVRLAGSLCSGNFPGGFMGKGGSGIATGVQAKQMADKGATRANKFPQHLTGWQHLNIRPECLNRLTPSGASSSKTWPDSGQDTSSWISIKARRAS